jgi:predicted ATP-grasp superfamily ATP-dependent carboligase
MTPVNGPATAVVMNLFYTGLGIARSLGERGVRVVGLTAERGVYGNFSRHVKAVRCADSRTRPEALLNQLLDLGRQFRHRSVLFPTRDHDLIFLDRYREELAPHFLPVMPRREALSCCLDKWETYLHAKRAGVPTPRCWLVGDEAELRACARELAYPCILKPLASHHWHGARNWELVGARKAISVESEEQLLREYAVIARVEPRVLVQERVAGGDDCLVIAACYIDQQSIFRAGFNTQKLVQVPAEVGTGCIVQSADRPELFEPTVRLLRAMAFTGIAEVEYKWDAAAQEYKLIEVNPRPWDQHRLGAACGVDLVYQAYCDHAGQPVPMAPVRYSAQKWIAEDALLMAVLRLLWRREPGVRSLLRQARGRKQFAIWSAKDPLPFLAYLVGLIPNLAALGVQATRSLAGKRSTSGRTSRLEGAR